MKIKLDSRKFGKLFGFFITFLTSTIVLYFVLQFSNRLPENWGYLHVFLTALSVILTGILIKMLLK
jgi:hypothetical protein